MFELTIRDGAVLILNGATLLMVFGIMGASSILRKRGRNDDKLFLILMLLTVVATIADSIGYLMDGKAIPQLRIPYLVSMTVFYSAYILVSMTWYHYTKVRFKGGGANIHRGIRPSYIAGTVVEIILLVNLFTGWIFSVDDALLYHRNVLFWPMYAVILFYAFAGFYNLEKYRVKTTQQPLIPVWLYAFPGILAVIITIAFQTAAIAAPMGIALSLAYTHLGSINEVIDMEAGEK